MTALGQAVQWATLAASAATVLALLGVWLQLRSAAKVQEQSAANSLYSSFLTLAASNPGPLNNPPLEIEVPGSQYDWMLYQWLTALESGSRAFDRNTEWNRRIRSCVRQNPKFFLSRYWSNKVSQDFDPIFITDVRKAVQEEAVE